MSSTLQEPALLQLLLPKPQGGAGLGKPLDVYADNLVFPRGCTPPGAPGSQHHCLFYDRARGCPHRTALPVEHHVYTSTGSYSSFISKISSVLSLNNFFPCLLPCQVFISLHIKKTSSSLSFFLLLQWVYTFLYCFFHRPHIHSPGDCMSSNICPGLRCSTETLHYAWYLVWPLASLCLPVLTGWHVSNLPRCIHLLSQTRWNGKFLITFSCNQNQFLS